jgi:protein-S-isoprenylcysteine O-methyltransferase Ste14
MLHVTLQLGLVAVIYLMAGAGTWWISLLEWAAIGLGLVAVFTMRWSNFRVLPDPKIDAELRISGLYQFVRHPMYTAVGALTLGWTLRSETWWAGVCWLCLLGVLWSKSRREELKLVALFPEYAEYRERTAAFFPKIR